MLGQRAALTQPANDPRFTRSALAAPGNARRHRPARGLLPLSYPPGLPLAPMLSFMRAKV